MGNREWGDMRPPALYFLFPITHSLFVMNVGLEHYLTVSAALFCTGLLGVLLRRNVLVIYMGLELMLNAANLALVAFSRFNNDLDGQVMVFFIITVAAAEVAVGLALIVALYRKRASAHVEDLTSMKL
jgi:NADH-quinone oxidoreductase subunit K